MKGKQLTTIIIFLAAIAIGIYVIYDDHVAQRGNDSQLEQYLENEGIETLPSSEQSIEVGVKAIDFTLPLYSEEGQMGLSQFEGEFLMVNMWASWCPPCRDEMPHFLKFHEEFEEENVQLLGINMTTVDTNETAISRFIEDFNIPYPVLMDVNGDVYNNYQVMYIPITYIIDPDGNVANIIRGYVNYEILVDHYETAVERYKTSYQQ
ncbi:TlpA disulfide reductase family protein [Evansella tamaricis]|uniref:TlpA family protein disulfide reductase n=1 Tax=Evansella tamaricis TaxID=2069301 RepID=A0ABS6JM47_9BACI|nr:TlpA disulfide reductase family protein [Evansella tamaricis]MBU9714751.1 TlpA family protein disulfide reductase [Evansella tamaricis]